MWLPQGQLDIKVNFEPCAGKGDGAQEEGKAFEGDEDGSVFETETEIETETKTTETETDENGGHKFNQYLFIINIISITFLSKSHHNHHHVLIVPIVIMVIIVIPVISINSLI